MRHEVVPWSQILKLLPKRDHSAEALRGTDELPGLSLSFPEPTPSPEVDNRHERRKRAAKERRWSR